MLYLLKADSTDAMLNVKLYVTQARLLKDRPSQARASRLSSKGNLAIAVYENVYLVSIVWLSQTEVAMEELRIIVRTVMFSVETSEYSKAMAMP
jgi:hypothetical protein